MIRRSFIKSISLSVFAPLLQWKSVFERLGTESVLDNGIKEIIAIDNVGDKIQLHWENPIPKLDLPLPDWTWREFLRNAYDYGEDEFTEKNLEEEWYLSLDELDRPCEHFSFEDWWVAECFSTTRDVFNHLQFVDISDELKDSVHFIECPSPCSDYIGVEVDDEESLKQFERELNQQGMDIRFKLIYDWDELD
jgi:hypothetical protein